MEVGIIETETPQAYDETLAVKLGCTLDPFTDTEGLFWWPFEDESGDRIDVVNGVPLIPGNEIHMLQAAAKVGNGLRFIPNINAHVIIQSALLEDLFYAGGGFDSMFWLKINAYGAASQVLVPRLRFYDADDNPLADFTFNAFNAVVAKITCHNNGETIEVDSPTVPVAGTWYCIRAFYDAADKKVGIQINNGAVVKSDDAFVAAMPAAAKAQCGVWHLGSGGGSQDDFLADELVVRIGGLFSAAEVTSYFNDGTGRTY